MFLLTAAVLPCIISTLMMEAAGSSQNIDKLPDYTASHLGRCGRITQQCYSVEKTGFTKCLQVRFVTSGRMHRALMWPYIIPRTKNVIVLPYLSSLWMWHKFNGLKIYIKGEVPPLTVAVRSLARNVFGLSNSSIVGSSPTGGMIVCLRLFYLCVILCR
jgi:hypothetical protein